MSSRFVTALLLASTLLLAACSGGSSTPSPMPSIGSPIPADLEAQLDRALSDTLTIANAPNGVAAVSAPGIVTWEGSFTAPDAPETPTDQDRYPIRSVTKSFTVTLVLQLVDEGEVSMKDPIDDYVPGVPNGENVTLSQLAAMRSGLPDYSQNKEFLKKFTEDFERQWTNQELLDFAFDMDPSFAPGEGYQYSNTNTVLLGEVVENVTGAPLRESLEEKIWKPLKMVQSTYPDSADIPTPHLQPFVVDPATGETEKAPTLNLSALGASGGIVSSLHDLPLWATALGDGSLIGRKQQTQRLAAFGPTDGGPLYDEYGWGMGKLDGWIGHTGEGIGYQAASFYRPEDGATIVVLLNSSQDDNIATEVFQALAAALPPG